MIGHLLNRDPELWRHTQTSDGMGGSTVEWANQGPIPARFSRPSPAERRTAAQEGVEVSHNVFLLPGADVRRGDRLVDGDLTLEIISVVAPSVPDHHLKATARQEPWNDPID